MLFANGLLDGYIGKRSSLLEDNVGDAPNPDDDENYDVNTKGGEGDDSSTPPANDPASSESDSSEGGDNPSDEVEDDENFDVDTEDGEGDDSGDDPESGDIDNPSEGEDDEADENFDVDTEGGDGESNNGDDNTGGDTPSSSDTSSSTADDPKSKLKELEASIFDQLPAAQKELKIKELKSLYINVYDKCRELIDTITEMDKDPSKMKVYDYIMNSLADLRQYIKDYLANVFDSKSYIENLTEFQKYLTILDTINTVFSELNKDINNEDK